MKNKQTALVLPPDETVILEKNASMKNKWYNSISGRVLLTNKSLYFKSNKADSIEDATRISLKNIHVLRKSESLKMIPNRMIVGDHQGTEYVFNVWNRNEFYNAVENQLK